MTDYSDEQIEALVKRLRSAFRHLSDYGPRATLSVIDAGAIREAADALASLQRRNARRDLAMNAILDESALLRSENADLQRRNAELEAEVFALHGAMGEDRERHRDHQDFLASENAALQKAKREVEALCDAADTPGENDAMLELLHTSEIRAAYATSQPQEDTP